MCISHKKSVFGLFSHFCRLVLYKPWVCFILNKLRLWAWTVTIRLRIQPKAFLFFPWLRWSDNKSSSIFLLRENYNSEWYLPQTRTRSVVIWGVGRTSKLHPREVFLDTYWGTVTVWLSLDVRRPIIRSSKLEDSVSTFCRNLFFYILSSKESNSVPLLVRQLPSCSYWEEVVAFFLPEAVPEFDKMASLAFRMRQGIRSISGAVSRLRLCNTLVVIHLCQKHVRLCHIIKESCIPTVHKTYTLDIVRKALMKKIKVDVSAPKWKMNLKRGSLRWQSRGHLMIM